MMGYEGQLWAMSKTSAVITTLSRAIESASDGYSYIQEWKKAVDELNDLIERMKKN